MEVIPAVDIRLGKCVRLTKGKAGTDTVYYVDLDGGETLRARIQNASAVDNRFDVGASVRIRAEEGAFRTVGRST